MSSPIAQFVDDVARRMRMQTALGKIVTASVQGSWTGAVVALALIYGCPGPWRFSALAVAAAFPLIAAARSWRKPLQREAAARKADQFYELKDRVSTALDVLGRRERTAMTDLQLRDAEERLKQSDAREIVKLDPPRRTTEAICPLLLLLALVGWPWSPLAAEPPADASEPTGPAIIRAERPPIADEQPSYSANSTQLGGSEAVRRYFSP